MCKFKRCRLFVLLLAAVLLIPFVPHPAARAEENEDGRTVIGREDHAFVELPGFIKPAEPSINSYTGILVELNSGTILYAKNINQRMFPASITKVMTALLALENLDLDDTLTISYNATHDLIDGGFDWRFHEGQVFTIEEALYGLCLGSVNTLGYALAEKMAGDVPSFAAMMNARAAELGALNTSFTNPHGLNDLNHLTTAYDMAKILWGAIEIDDYRRIAGTDSYVCAEEKDGQEMSFSHTIRFLHPENGWYDARVVCAKSGWTEDAWFTRAVYATNGSLDLICVVFHSDGADAVDKDVLNLLNYGFNNYSLISEPVFGETNVLQGKIKDQNGVDQLINFVTGAGRPLNGAKLLIPNTYQDMKWHLDLTLSGDELKGYASLGGVSLVEFPLSIVLPEETTKSDYFPTTVPTTRQTEEYTDPAAPDRSSPADRQGQSSPGLTENESSGTPNGQGGPDTPEQRQGSLLIFALVLCAAFLMLCLIGLLVTVSQNRRLRRRMSRRDALKKKQ